MGQSLWKDDLTVNILRKTREVMEPTKMVTFFGYKMAKDGRLIRKHLNSSVWVVGRPVTMVRKRCSRMAALTGILLWPQVRRLSLIAVMKTVGPMSTKHTVQNTVQARDLRVKKRQLRNSTSWDSPKPIPGYHRTELTVQIQQKRHHPTTRALRQRKFWGSKQKETETSFATMHMPSSSGPCRSRRVSRLPERFAPLLYWTLRGRWLAIAVQIMLYKCAECL